MVRLETKYQPDHFEFQKWHSFLLDVYKAVRLGGADAGDLEAAGVDVQLVARTENEEIRCNKWRFTILF